MIQTWATSEPHISMQETYFKRTLSCAATGARRQQVQLWCFTRLQRKITGMVRKQAQRGALCERLKSTSASSRNMKERWCFTLQKCRIETALWFPTPAWELDGCWTLISAFQTIPFQCLCIFPRMLGIFMLWRSFCPFLKRALTPMHCVFSFPFFKPPSMERRKKPQKELHVGSTKECLQGLTLERVCLSYIHSLINLFLKLCYPVLQQTKANIYLQLPAIRLQVN